MDEISTTVAGIPCTARVTAYSQGWAATRFDPAEDEEVEFEILDRNGNPAAWLARKVTDEDHTRITDELLAAINAPTEYYE